MHVPMPDGVRLSLELPQWVKLSIADAVVLFGRMEQEAIEISWVLTDAGLKERLKLARNPGTSLVKETSMSSLVSNPKNPAAFSIRVEGMACDSCVERVEKAIRATPGVVSASVNLATKRAEVTFSGVPDIAAVIAAVGVAGYECMVENASSSNLS
jgi:copper chaperone CopZ